MLENADGTQDVANNLGLAREVRGVTEDGLGASLKLHLLNAGHGGLDADGLVALVNQLVDVGVEHVGAAVDGRQAGKALGELAETVERVDVRRLAVASDRVAVHANALNGVGSLAAGCSVFVSEVESHGMADEVLGASLEAKLVIHLAHGAGVHVETWVGKRQHPVYVSWVE